jgi:outer membrane protein assembly factor BamB
VDCKEEFSAPKGFFGLACSPLLEGKAVIVNVGGRIQHQRRDELRGSHELQKSGTRIGLSENGAASIVAFDQETGKLLWHAVEDEPSYSSPVAATLGGRRYALVLTRSFFIGCEPTTGEVAFRHPFRPPIHASVSGATPLAVGDEVFISAGYDLGAVLFRVDDRNLQEVWSGDDQLSLQYSTAVHHQGFLYGLHGRHDFPGGTELRCVEWRTGKVRWGKPGLNGANLILAGDSLLVLTENGELIRFAAEPGKYRELSRAQILGRGVRAYPALANGRFYARDKAQLVCLDLRAR